MFAFIKFLMGFWFKMTIFAVGFVNFKTHITIVTHLYLNNWKKSYFFIFLCFTNTITSILIKYKIIFSCSFPLHICSFLFTVLLFIIRIFIFLFWSNSKTSSRKTLVIVCTCWVSWVENELCKSSILCNFCINVSEFTRGKLSIRIF